MGAEELDGDFEEVWNECVPNFGDKPVALFGSYDWGTGEWMETWRDSATDAGVNVIDCVIANLEPDDEAEDALKAAGAKCVYGLDEILKIGHHRTYPFNFMSTADSA
jgi:flavodoxin